MKLQVLLLVAYTTIAAAAALDTSHPVESVITLLKELQGKVETQGKEEEVTYSKFVTWCGDSVDELDEAVKQSTEEIDSLTDTVSQKKKEIEGLEEDLKFLAEEIKKYQADGAQAKKDRESAAKLYDAADSDFKDTIDAVKAALKALKDSEKAAFLQEDQRLVLQKLVQQPLVLEQLTDSEREAFSAAAYGDAAAPPVSEADILAKEKYAKTGKTYTFKSGNVIELLKSLLEHFEDKRNEATKEETASLNAYDVAKGARDDAIKAAEGTEDKKTELLGDTKGDLAEAEGNLRDEKDELKADTKLLADTKKMCTLKKSEWEERSELRKQEIEAMEAAIKILAKVTGVRTAPPDNPTLPSPPTLLQLAKSIKTAADPAGKMKAVNLLKQKAQQFHSKQLQQFAQEIATRISADDPFDVVNQMIQKMIFRLMAEQKDEDEHKHWCDLEISTSETSKETKEEKVKSLEAKIKADKATADALEIKVKELNKKVADITKFMAEATETRTEGKKENMVAIKDAEQAQAAIAKAQAVLETYYKESGMIEKKAWEFIQEPEPVKLPKNPDTWGSSYTGVTDPTQADTGCIAVLKATGEKFSRMEADTRAQELTDQKQFDEDMQSSDIEKAKTAKESEMKEAEQKRLLDKVNTMTKQKKHVASELGAVEQYLKDLEPACVDGDSTYEDRKKKRDDEIEALRKSQGILQDAFEEKTTLLQVGDSRSGTSFLSKVSPHN